MTGDSFQPDSFQPDSFQEDAPASSAATASISAAPTGAKAWLQNLEGDIRYGTGTTGPGKLLQWLGAPGVNRGVSEQTANQMTSPILGPIHAAQGVSEMGQHPFIGALKAASGVAETASLPASFIAPSGKAGQMALEAGAVGYKTPIIGRLFASTARAGQAFQDVNQAIGKVPLNVTPELSDAALAVMKESELGGGNVPQVVRKFIQRITSPDKPPLNFEDARRFASNASGLSASEWFNMLKNGNMRRLIGQFHGAFNDAIQATADNAGVGKQFLQAMQEYSQAKGNASAAKALLGAGAIGAVGGPSAVKGAKAISKLASLQ